MDFNALGLRSTLLRGIEDLGFTTPTPIQTQAIPEALQGRDILACAATGSGKTAAFLLPILERIADEPRGTTRALVLAPTRELAMQIVAEFENLAKHTGMRGAAVYGGVGMAPQERALRQGVDVIVATPGRLLDHFQRGNAPLKGLEVLVLDEADRMLDMGFLPDIKRVLRHVPKPEQILFFSATMPPAIERLTKELLTDPFTVALQRKAQPAEGVKQTVYPVARSEKARLLIELIKREGMYDALVFTRTKHGANRLAKKLNKAGITAERIHGNRSQSQRTKALAGFKRGDFQVLVATDVASRGIDVEELGHVVNFDLPNVPEDYIHRVGRTGRAGETGDAFSFVTPECEEDIARIERAIGKKIPRVKVEGFDVSTTPEDPAEVRRDARAAQRSGRRGPRGRSGASSGGRSKGAAPKSKGGGTPKTQHKDDGQNDRPRRRRFGKRRG
ncbi:MAG: DEAD/DEAH box helicase [Gemmatimonadetes bacterium]|nr:DEAD/DEAH box helicase [Gemmatimonadota bacterium]